MYKHYQIKCPDKVTQLAAAQLKKKDELETAIEDFEKEVQKKNKAKLDQEVSSFGASEEADWGVPRVPIDWIFTKSRVRIAPAPDEHRFVKRGSSTNLLTSQSQAGAQTTEQAEQDTQETMNEEKEKRALDEKRIQYSHLQQMASGFYMENESAFAHHKKKDEKLFLYLDDHQSPCKPEPYIMMRMRPEQRRLRWKIPWYSRLRFFFQMV